MNKEINDVFIIKASEDKKDASQQIKTWKTLNVQQPRYSFTTLTEFYDINTWHARCISLKAALCTQLGYNIVTDDSKKEPDEEYRKLEEFLSLSDDEDVNFSELAFRTAIDYFSIGNGFIEISRNMKNEISRLFHVPGRTVRRHVNMDAYWQVRSGKQQFFWQFGMKNHKENKYGNKYKGNNEIAQLMNYDPKSDYYGKPEWIPAMAAISLDRSSVSYNIYNFENEMLAKTMMVIRGASMSKEARNNIQGFLSTNFTDTKNAGKMLIIPIEDRDVEVDVHKLQMDTKDIAFLNGRRFNRDEVIQAHGVPPRLLGIMSAGKLGGGGEAIGQMRIFKETLIDPEKKRIERFFNRILKNGLGLKKWRIEFNEFDISSDVEDADFLQKIGMYLTDDEARERIGYLPRDTKPALQKKANDLIAQLVELRKQLQESDDQR